MNKILKKIILFLLLILAISSIYNNLGYANKDKVTTPEVHCIWLPWCEDEKVWVPKENITINSKWNLVTRFLSNTVWTLIWYTTAIWVIAIMFSGFIYMTSGWDEEKANKAKKWITWILTWVIASLLAYTAINIIDNLEFKVSNEPWDWWWSSQPAK